MLTLSSLCAGSRTGLKTDKILAQLSVSEAIYLIALYNEILTGDNLHADEYRFIDELRRLGYN